MAAPSEIEKLERRYSENPDGRFFAPLADAYRKAGNVDRALELVRAGLNKHPEYLSAYIVLGRCFLDKNNDAEAANTFQRVLALDAENIIALKSLAEIAERGGRNAEARSWLQKLLVVDSMNAEAEADLERLGGLIAKEPTQAMEPVKTPAEAGVSFADVAREVEAAAPAGAAPSGEAAVAAAAPAAEPAAARAAEPAAPSAAGPAAPAASEAVAPPAGEPAPPAPEPAAAAPAPAPPTVWPGETPPTLPRVSAPLAIAPVQAAASAEPAGAAASAGPAGQAPAAEPEAPRAEQPHEAPGALHPEPAAAGPEAPGEGGEAYRPPAAELPEPVPDRHPLPDQLQVADSGLDLMPFDDSLAWGTGERSSRAIRVEDVAHVEHDQELTSPAVEFISGIEGATEAGAGGGVTSLDFTIETPPGPDQFPSIPAEEAPDNLELPANLSGSYSLLDEKDYVPMPAGTPPADLRSPVPPGAGVGEETALPLIMPEDVTPPDELARPSAKLVQMVSPAPAAPAEAGGIPEPMLTETLGDLYSRQGFRSEAAAVYRKLLAQRPGDPGLSAKLRALEAPPPNLSAISLGAESVGSWLRRVAAARIPGSLSVAAAPAAPAAAAPPSAPAPATPAPSPGLSPLEAAFTAPAAGQDAGEPAHPAPDAFSLDQIFGATPDSGSAPKAAPEPAPSTTPPPAASPGSSFDEFFGSTPEPGTVRPSTASPEPSPQEGAGGEEDLSAFNAWLQGLKR